MTPIPTTFDLSISKTQVSANPVFGSAPLDYSIVVSNNGPSGTAANVSFVDNGPPAASYTVGGATNTAVGGGATPFSCIVDAGNMVTCSGASIPTGGSATVTITGITSSAACGTTLSDIATLTSPPDLNPVNNTSTVTTPIVCADIDVILVADNSPFVGPDDPRSDLWQSGALFAVFNDSATPISAPITFQVDADSGNSSAPIGGQILFITGGNGSWTCPLTLDSGQHLHWVCTGSLAAKSGATGNDTPDVTYAGGGSPAAVYFDVGITGGPSPVASTVTWTTSTTCGGSPAPCTSGTVSPANSDGSDLQPGDTDPIFASDLDAFAFVDNPGGEDLIVSDATGYTSLAKYGFFNDGPVDITGISFGGVISGSATRGAVAVTINNGAAFGANPAWSCTTTVNSWSCTGSLSGDTGIAGNNAPDGTPTNQVSLTVAVTGVGAGGDTVRFTPSTPTCGTPKPISPATSGCVPGTPSPANMDGGNGTPAPGIVYPFDVDTLS